MVLWPACQDQACMQLCMQLQSPVSAHLTEVKDSRLVLDICTGLQYAQALLISSCDPQACQALVGHQPGRRPAIWARLWQRWA